MPSVRLEQFLASTAVALFLTAAASAETLTPQPLDSPDLPPSKSAAMSAPAPTDANSAATPATAQAQDSTQEIAAPQSTGSITILLPAAPAAAAPEPATPPADAAAPASPAPAATAATPVPAPAAAAAPLEVPVPAAATSAPAPQPAQAATAEPATPASTLNAADAAIADQLRTMSSGKFDKDIGNRKDRIVIDAFYSGRDYAPLWVTDGKANEQAKAAINYLHHVDADGLDPADYVTPDFASTDPATLANAEIKLSMALITYAHHASVGRVHWSRVSPDISYDTKAPEPADVLAAMVEAKDIPLVLDSYEPQMPQYKALKAKLAEYRAGKSDPSKPQIAAGPAPKIGAEDDRVPELRARLDVPGDGSSTYDKALAEAVKKYQQEHELKVTGLLTPQTIEAMNGKQPDKPIDIILANLERWRWMPHDLGKDYVIVNLPDFTLRLMHNEKLYWMTRIVDGKPEKPTPIMQAEMKYITINPTWHVPPSIVNGEYLPALAQDPTVLDRMGLKVSKNPDGSTAIWQPPGDKNALGRIRFNFPNKFLVYQHDTPDKYLFAYDKRAYSHGCMRVQDPPKYAEMLLSIVRPNDGYSLDRIHKMINEGGEQDIQFPTSSYIPVNLTYQTAFVDDDGKLQFRDDVYGRDRQLLAILKSSELKVADIPVEHHEDARRREALAIPDGTPLTGGPSGPGGRAYYPGGGSDGGNFLSRLFGGFSQPAAAPTPKRHAAAPQQKQSSAGGPIQR
jgi:murein L,D-transpeptidase YcbB/YkuD